jgi:hypothetical protein
MPRQRRPKAPPPPPVHPDLQALQDQREKLEEQVSDLDDQINRNVFRLVIENQGKILDYAREEREGKPYEEDEIVLGYHSCKGPLGLCVYDDTTDPVHDCCLFCGDPDERK